MYSWLKIANRVTPYLFLVIHHAERLLVATLFRLTELCDSNLNDFR